VISLVGAPSSTSQLLFLWFAFFTLGHDWLHRLHGRWFSLSAETFDAIHYPGMGGFKIAILRLNVVPYFVLRIGR